LSPILGIPPKNPTKSTAGKHKPKIGRGKCRCSKPDRTAQKNLTIRYAAATIWPGYFRRRI
jgi:hypothetical protein